MKRRLLFISTIFPSVLANKHATYNLQALNSLQQFFDIDVINPIPWHLKIKDSITFKYPLNGLKVCHPTYWYPPGFVRNLYGLFYFLSIKLCVAKISKEKRPDVVLSSWLYPDGWAACKFANLYGIPSVLHAIGTDVNRLEKKSAIANKTIQAVSLSKSTVCVSNALKDKLINIGADSSKIHVLNTGVDRNVFFRIEKNAIRKKLGYSLSDKLILYVGNLIETKGLNELADAFLNISKYNHFFDVKLIIAGGGNYESTFVEKLKALGIFNRTVFMGSCALSEVAKLMNVADVVCLPSYSEGLPNVILEALCCNAKVVSTEVGGIPELAERHQNLYLVPPRNSAKLSEALVTAIQADCADDAAEDILSWSDYAKHMLGYL